MTLPADPIEEACEYLKNVSEEMGVKATIDVRQEGKNVTFQFSW